MKVILLQELKGKGGEGDVVEVTRGHAVNFLFPKKIAIEATKGNLKQLELRKHNIAKRETERLDTADKLFEALNESVITVRARVGEEGQLFGSVTSSQIAEAIHEKYGVDIDRKKIEIRTAIKTDGEHPVSIAIYRDVKAQVTINVIDEKAVEEVDAAVDETDENAVSTDETVEETAEVEAAEEAAEEAEAADAADAAEQAAEAVEAVEEAEEAAEVAEEAAQDAEPEVSEETTE